MKLKTLLLVFLLTIFPSSYVHAYLDFTLSDFCYLQPNVQTRDSVYYFPNEEVGITATSICVYKDAYGQYASKGNLKNGIIEGLWTEWHTNGMKRNEFTYIDNKNHGKGNSWYKNGQMKLKVNFLDDEFDGKLLRWWENGQLKSEEHFKNGKEVGRHWYWYQNGQLKWYADYEDGECIGHNSTKSGWCVFFDLHERLPL